MSAVRESEGEFSEKPEPGRMIQRWVRLIEQRDDGSQNVWA